jgi:hypothetical protein
VQVSTGASGNLDDSFLRSKKWLLNERKRQWQEEDKSTRSSDANGNDAIKMSERNRNTSSKLPNQYAKVKNAVKEFKMTQIIIMDLMMNSLKKL